MIRRISYFPLTPGVTTIFYILGKTRHDLITSTTLVTSSIMHKRDGTFEKSFATLSPSFVLMFKWHKRNLDVLNSTLLTNLRKCISFVLISGS